MFEELHERLKMIGQRLEELRGIFDIESKAKKIRELESEIAQPNFWNDTKKANKKIKELKLLKASLEPWKEANKGFKDTKELFGIVEEADQESIKHIDEEVSLLESKLDSIEFKSLLGKPEDKNNAILSINAGAGGTESCDWVSMLLRMYSKWAASKKFEVEQIDFLAGEEAGIKNVTVIVKGAYAYGYLKAESGVHRLVRISPFDSNRRRHTSFASVDVIPEVSDDITIDVKESDLRIDTFRSSGRGGQHVNVTDSAVRITHMPTNIVVQCQNERSQHKNKTTAMKVLKARLYELEREKRTKELERQYSAKQRIEWGSQIRSYVMHPYSLVKDHRTNYQTSNVQSIMDGSLEGFMEAYLKSNIKSKK
ncbi:peptide chain release factor 2 [Omnitrophica bacterium]|nr:peptide chain release factor 2 [Candidatus Omnitrophota bacterium]